MLLDVNFTNILKPTFAPIILRQISTNLKCKYKKAAHKNFHKKKAASKTFIRKSCSQNVGEIDPWRGKAEEKEENKKVPESFFFFLCKIKCKTVNKFSPRK
jgi:hypothetical protein